MTFTRLTVKSFVGIVKHKAVWRCLCQCGNFHEASRDSLMSGSTKSCGCLQRNPVHQSRLTHGASRKGRVTAEYRTFTAAKRRCNRPTASNYQRYGGRGIRFLFESFEQFYAELGPKPTPKHSINRIDNDGNYEPGNVEWATPSQQRRNQRVFI